MTDSIGPYVTYFNILGPLASISELSVKLVSVYDI